MIKKILFAIFVVIILAYAARIGYHKFFTANPSAKSVPVDPLKVRLTEGWTLDDIADNLSCLQKKSGTPSGNSGCAATIDKQTFFNSLKKVQLTDYPILASKPASAGLEGFIFPDTYFLTDNASSTPITISNQLVQKALDNFSIKFTKEMESKAKEENISVFDIVTLASIIEKETGRNVITEQQKQALDTERKIIAGIFYNRLKIQMPLDSDATVNYVTHKNTPSVSTQDLTINSPYNTYKYTGLPPGPISNPSLSSILAALYPTKSDYLYFLHKQPSGEAVYSKTFEEHVANKYKYLR